MKCDMVCGNETSLKADMHATHIEDLRKYFAKDTLEMIVHDVEYGYRLKKTALIGTIENYPARTRSARARRACALRALGLLLADGAPTVGGGKTF